MKKLDEKNSQLLKVILISILVFFAFWYIENVKNGLTVFIAVIQPFLIGFMLAFIINLPMNFFERKVYSKIFKTEKTKKVSSSFFTYIFLDFIYFGYCNIFECINSKNI